MGQSTLLQHLAYITRSQSVHFLQLDQNAAVQRTDNVMAALVSLHFRIQDKIFQSDKWSFFLQAISHRRAVLCGAAGISTVAGDSSGWGVQTLPHCTSTILLLDPWEQLYALSTHCHCHSLELHHGFCWHGKAQHHQSEATESPVVF